MSNKYLYRVINRGYIEIDLDVELRGEWGTAARIESKPVTALLDKIVNLPGVTQVTVKPYRLSVIFSPVFAPTAIVANAIAAVKEHLGLAELVEGTEPNTTEARQFVGNISLPRIPEQESILESR